MILLPQEARASFRWGLDNFTCVLPMVFEVRFLYIKGRALDPPLVRRIIFLIPPPNSPTNNFLTHPLSPRRCSTYSLLL